MILEQWQFPVRCGRRIGRRRLAGSGAARSGRAAGSAAGALVYAALRALATGVPGITCVDRPASTCNEVLNAFDLLLLAHLAGAGWLHGRFLTGTGSFAALTRWQTAYLPVYGVWAALVVVIFPPLFGYR